MANTYVYPYRDALYINLTNRCTNDCEFCLRRDSDGVGGSNLWLDEEPEAAQVLMDFADYDMRKVSEVVFCGFGEPTMRLMTLLTVARAIKALHPDLPIRINTNGQANLYHDRDVTGDMVGLIDSISVSLNAPTAAEYDAICHSDYGTAAFEGMLDFCRKCVDRGIGVTMTVLSNLGDEKIEASRVLAREIGVEFRVRAYIDHEQL